MTKSKKEKKVKYTFKQWLQDRRRVLEGMVLLAPIIDKMDIVGARLKIAEYDGTPTEQVEALRTEYKGLVLEHQKIIMGQY